MVSTISILALIILGLGIVGIIALTTHYITRTHDLAPKQTWGTVSLTTFTTGSILVYATTPTASSVQLVAYFIGWVLFAGGILYALTPLIIQHTNDNDTTKDTSQQPDTESSPDRPLLQNQQ